MKNKGFTLIELIVVFTIIGLLSSISIQSFIDYNRKQKLDATANTLTTVLTTARSRAQSQVKPSGSPCSTNALDGYRILFSCVGGGCQSSPVAYYQVYAVCQTQLQSIPNSKVNIPSEVSVSVSTGTFTFRVITGSVVEAVDAGSTAVFTSYGRSKTVRVFRDSRVRVE